RGCGALRVHGRWCGAQLRPRAAWSASGTHQRFRPLIKEKIMSIVCLSTNGHNLYAGNGQPEKLFIATTEGLAVGEFVNGEWRAAQTVFEGQHVGALVYVPEENALFVGLMPGGLKYSGDLGKTWEDRSSGINEEKVYSLRANREAEGIV